MLTGPMLSARGPIGCGREATRRVRWTGPSDRAEGNPPMVNEQTDQADGIRDPDTAGHALQCTPAAPEDQQWLLDRMKAGVDGRVLVRLDDDQDVAGHLAAADPTMVRVVVQDDEMDTVGHAISIRLPSAAEAEAFRRRILLTGVLVGTIALTGAGAILAVSQGQDAPAEQATGQIEDVSYEDATPYSGTL